MQSVGVTAVQVVSEEMFYRYYSVPLKIVLYFISKDRKSCIKAVDLLVSPPTGRESHSCCRINLCATCRECVLQLLMFLVVSLLVFANYEI